MICLLLRSASCSTHAKSVTAAEVGIGLAEDSERILVAVEAPAAAIDRVDAVEAVPSNRPGVYVTKLASMPN